LCRVNLSVAANEIRPSYGFILLANFTALDPFSGGKVADRTCARAYGEYFIHRIKGLATYVASNQQFITANPSCGVSGITVAVSVRNLTQGAYYSEYSRVSIDPRSIYPWVIGHASSSKVLARFYDLRQLMPTAGNGPITLYAC